MPSEAAIRELLGDKLRNPAPAPSLADMYRDILPGNGGGLTSRKVQTVPIDEATGNPILSGGTTYFPPGPAYGYNAATGDYEVQQPGNAYAVGGGKPNFDYAPGVQAIDNAAPDLASLFANMAGRGSAGFTGPNTLPVDSSIPLNRTGGAISATGQPSAIAAPAPPPKTPLQSLADMFTPAKPAVKGYNGSTVMRSSDVAGGSGSIFGENAVLPASMNNERWNTGY